MTKRNSASVLRLEGLAADRDFPQDEPLRNARIEELKTGDSARLRRLLTQLKQRPGSDDRGEIGQGWTDRKASDGGAQ